MRLLMHVCCGPCAIVPFRRLIGAGHEVSGLFYNPNIHPYQEFCRRLEAARQWAVCEAEREGLSMRFDACYGIKAYLREVVFHEEERCLRCYAMRLRHIAEVAATEGFEAFTTTLLYSKYQNHQRIAEIGEEMARQYHIPFYYEDFRSGWQEGVDASIRLGLYRQPYCGCIYSEWERYDKGLRKKNKQAV